MSAVAEGSGAGATGRRSADNGRPRGDIAAEAAASIHNAAPRWPGDGKDFRVTMGLHVCTPEAWLLPAAAAADLLSNKAEVLAAHHDDAFAVLPEGDAAAREAAHVLFTHIATHDPDAVTVVPELLVAEADEQHPLERVSRLIAEDVCIMTRHPVGAASAASAAATLQSAVDDGGASGASSPASASAATADAATHAAAGTAHATEYRLTAAVLCAPSRWSLREKLGTNLGSIHSPVPGYDTIAAPTERFFARLPVGDIMERTNWSVLESPTLFQPGFGHSQDEAATALGDAAPHAAVATPADDAAASSRAADQLSRGAESRPLPRGADVRAQSSVLQRRWLRLERQTLRKLPQTGAVVFTILTTNTRLDDLAAHSPDVARQLAHKMRTAPQDTCVYKGWPDAAAVADALEAACSAA
ncbi:MAG: DUF3445 domain-containing protein [Actinomycetales bacterium]|nr:DUF3445 domain-containing protein [Actinomycetales bacterium]